MVDCTYRAWVPCITGKLAFSQIGRLCDPPTHFVKSLNTNDGCAVFCLQDRTSILDDSLFGWKGKIRKLFGVRIVFELDSFARFKGLEAPTLAGTIRCLAGKYSDIAPENGEKLREKEELFKVRFVLRRSGYARLFGFETNPIFSNGADLSEEEKVYFYAQSYIFLKDMVHRHRHHSAGDDTFVEMQSSSAGWKRRIAYQLMKRVIRRPISGDPNSFQDASGILSYLQSYQKSLSIKVYDDIYLDVMKQSFAAEHIKLKDKIADMRFVYTVIVGIFSFISIRFIDWQAEEFGFLHFGVPLFLVLTSIYFLNKSRVLRYDENRYFLDAQSFYSTSLSGRFITWGLSALSFALMVYLLSWLPRFGG